jgi:Domain of unknown function (DUF4136)
MRRLLQSGVIALSVCATTACAATVMTVSSHVERGLDLSRYHSFAWGPADALPTGDPRLDGNPFFKDRVQGAVEKQLALRGLPVTSAAADLLIHYHANITRRIDDVRELDRGYPPCAAANCQPFVYDAGSLFVDLVDPRANQLVWRGWAEGSVEGAIDNQKWMEARIDDAVVRIMRRLPLSRVR